MHFLLRIKTAERKTGGDTDVAHFNVGAAADVTMVDGGGGREARCEHECAPRPQSWPWHQTAELQGLVLSVYSHPAFSGRPAWMLVAVQTIPGCLCSPSVHGRCYLHCLPQPACSLANPTQSLQGWLLFIFLPLACFVPCDQVGRRLLASPGHLLPGPEETLREIFAYWVSGGCCCTITSETGLLRKMQAKNF